MPKIHDKWWNFYIECDIIIKPEFRINPSFGELRYKKTPHNCDVFSYNNSVSNNKSTSLFVRYRLPNLARPNLAFILS